MYTIQVLNYIWFTAFIRVLQEKFIHKRGYVVKMEGEGLGNTEKTKVK